MGFMCGRTLSYHVCPAKRFNCPANCAVYGGSPGVTVQGGQKRKPIIFSIKRLKVLSLYLIEHQMRVTLRSMSGVM